MANLDWTGQKSLRIMDCAMTLPYPDFWVVKTLKSFKDMHFCLVSLVLLKTESLVM